MIGYCVAPNKTIRGPDGKRFIVRGVQMFDYVFVSFETSRTDWRFRELHYPAGTGAAYGVSEPTDYRGRNWISAENVEAQIRLAFQCGANLLRVGVEPAIMFTPTSVDYVDGLTYPSDLDMLDTVINTAASYGVVVQLQNCNDNVPTADNLDFMRFLAARYYDTENVWINPANEINGVTNGAADVNNATIWQAEMRQYVLALREDIPGLPAGTKYRNPICVDLPGWSERLDLAYTALTTDSAFSDPNIIIQPHYYPNPGESNFKVDRLTQMSARWAQWMGSFCIMVGEVGIDNFAGRYDPNLDPSVASLNTTTWAQMQSAVTGFLQWCNEQTAGSFNGCIGHMWGSYVPGLSRHDDNSMRRNDGTWATWGNIYRDKFLCPPAIVAAPALYLAPGALNASNGTVGTPLLQAEAVAGVRGASMFIGPNSYASYACFHRRDTNAMTGQIVGNSGSGVSYTTVSDYRLKENPRDVSDELALSLLKRLRPVTASWKGGGGSREIMFLAHEVNEVLPGIVHGEKDAVDSEGNPVYQTMDYGRLTALLVAALQALAKQS